MAVTRTPTATDCTHDPTLETRAALQTRAKSRWRSGRSDERPRSAWRRRPAAGGTASVSGVLGGPRAQGLGEAVEIGLVLFLVRMVAGGVGLGHRRHVVAAAGRLLGVGDPAVLGDLALGAAPELGLLWVAHGSPIPGGRQGEPLGVTPAPPRRAPGRGCSTRGWRT